MIREAIIELTKGGNLSYETAGAVMDEIMNPVFHYGYEEFFAKCEELGVDGIISPELPYEERGEMLPFAAKHNVDMRVSFPSLSGFSGPLTVSGLPGTFLRFQYMPAAASFPLHMQRKCKIAR